MATDETLIGQVKMLLVERSKKSMDIARKAVLEEKFKHKPLQEALTYFITELWYNASHPALLSLTCEAVGGDPDATNQIGAAFVLLSGAADIHDDIIDQSLTKEGKQTIFGKYGLDMAIIAGNVLWFKGVLLLNQACDAFSTEKKEAILQLAKQSFFDIGSAEAKEASLRRNLDLQPQVYLEIIKMKISVAEAAAKIGATAGNGSAAQVECLGQYGKTLGTLMTIRDEFVDMFELDELQNRFRNECLPLPVLFALQDPDLKKEILGTLAKEDLTESELEKIVELVAGSSELGELKKEIKLSMEKTCECLFMFSKNQDLFNQLLKSTIEGLPI
jgi:geranylgeranyl pyrophosphate synthase